MVIKSNNLLNTTFEEREQLKEKGTGTFVTYN